jgi:hypothetical protein
VQRQGQAVELTSTEFELLVLLATTPGKVYSRDDILARLRGQPGQDIHSRAVDILVSRCARSWSRWTPSTRCATRATCLPGCGCEAALAPFHPGPPGAALPAAGAGHHGGLSAGHAAPAARRLAELRRPLVADYVDRLAAQIGSPPDVQRAQALTQVLPITVRIEGPLVQYDSHPGRRNARHDPSANSAAPAGAWRAPRPMATA